MASMRYKGVVILAILGLVAAGEHDFEKQGRALNNNQKARNWMDTIATSLQSKIKDSRPERKSYEVPMSGLTMKGTFDGTISNHKSVHRSYKASISGNTLIGTLMFNNLRIDGAWTLSIPAVGVSPGRSSSGRTTATAGSVFCDVRFRLSGPNMTPTSLLSIVGRNDIWLSSSTYTGLPTDTYNTAFSTTLGEANKNMLQNICYNVVQKMLENNIIPNL